MEQPCGCSVQSNILGSSLNWQELQVFSLSPSKGNPNRARTDTDAHATCMTRTASAAFVLHLYCIQLHSRFAIN